MTELTFWAIVNQINFDYSSPIVPVKKVLRARRF